MDSKTPNLDTLRQLYAQNPVAKAFLDHAARRERDQSETKVDLWFAKTPADREINNIAAAVPAPFCYKS
jgi:hypothetical protein